MSRGQLIVLGALELWVGIVCGAVLYWTASDAQQLAVLPALIALVLLVPVAIGLLIWLWVDGRNLKWGRNAAVLASPFMLAGLILVAPVVVDAFPTRTLVPAESPDSSQLVEETHERPPCEWASVVSDTVAELLTELRPLERLVRSMATPTFGGSDDRPNARSLAGDDFWPADGVWVENLEVSTDDFESLHWMKVSGRVRNWSVRSIRLTGIRIFFVTRDGDRVGDVACSLGGNGFDPCGVSETHLRSGYVADFEFDLGSGGLSTIPSLASRDTAEVWVRYCPTS